MIIIGIVLSFVGLGYLCWLIFALAVNALPLFAGVTAGLVAYYSNSGPIAAVAIAAIVSVIVLFAGQFALRALRSTPVRAAIALLFAGPAAMKHIQSFNPDPLRFSAALHGGSSRDLG